MRLCGDQYSDKGAGMIMKRIYIILAIIALACLNVNAQENRYEARLGWIPVDLLNLVYLMGEDPYGGTSYGPMKTVGVFSADFDFKIKNWLSVGAKVNYRNSWRDMTTMKGTSIDRLQALSFMPTARFTTGFDSKFRYYAMVGLGIGADLSTDSHRCMAAFQFTPVGIAVGKKISWYLELGLGHAYNGYITGLTWRF